MTPMGAIFNDNVLIMGVAFTVCSERCTKRCTKRDEIAMEMEVRLRLRPNFVRTFLPTFVKVRSSLRLPTLFTKFFGSTKVKSS